MPHDLAEEADLIRPMALRVTATLRLADHLMAGPRSAADLAPQLGVDAGALAQLLGYLASIDVVTRAASPQHGPTPDRREVAFRLRPRGETLRDGGPGSLRDRLDITTALGRAELSVASLLDAVTTGAPAFVSHYGVPFWTDLGSDADRHAGYDRQMAADAERWTAALIPAYPWADLTSLIDVGGGNGTLLAGLLAAVPTLTGTVLDQEATAEAAQATLDAAGVGDRGDAVAGNFFDELPAGADAYLLVAVLHDWNDDAAQSILARCAQAAGEHGRVLVVERTGADGEDPSPNMDMRMLAYFGARERGVADLIELGRQVGVELAGVHTAGELAIIDMRLTAP
ncbi:MAG: methyltransferase [Actinomycetota bacterium]